ncbi:MAG: hypothetical protein ACRDTE_06260 [Pseudonocardiaceae bacterium]
MAGPRQPGQGAFDLARAELNSLTLPPVTADTAGLVCNLTLRHGHAAARDGRLDDAAAPVAEAAEIEERLGAETEADSLGFVHAPADVGLHRMVMALEANEPDRVVSIAGTVHPQRHPFAVGRAQIWCYYGRALAQLGGRRSDAVTALRRAEKTSPHHVLRDETSRNTAYPSAVPHHYPRTSTRTTGHSPARTGWPPRRW